MPGGVATIALGASPLRPGVRTGDVPVLVAGDPGGWTAVVGIALSAKPGKGTIVVARPGRPDERRTFEIAPVRLPHAGLGVGNGPERLHGRHSVLVSAAAELMAEVVEILPPAAGE